MRATLGVLACFTFMACLDFDKLINECRDGGGLCARDGGELGGDAGGGTGGGTGGSTGEATPDCDAGVAATLQMDGSTAFCFNGFTWENPLPHGVDLQAVWGPAPNDVWAAGAAGMLMHWDGGGWTSYQGKIPAQSAADRMGHIAAIVGSSGGAWLAGRGLQPHWLDGGSWTPTTAMLGARSIAALSVSPDGTHPTAVSMTGEVFLLPAWQLVSSPAGGEAPEFVRAVAIRDDGYCAFSGSFLSGSTSVARVWSCGGSSTWTFDAGDPGPVWVENGELVTASTNRRDPRATVWVLDRDGGARPRVSLSSDLVFTAAAFLPALDAGFLVGSSLTVADTSGNIFSGTGNGASELRGVWGFADGGAWAVGTSGAMLHQVGSQWVLRQQGFAQDLYGMWLQNDGGVFFSGQGAVVTDRVTGTPLPLGLDTLRDLHRFSDDSWLVASEDGNLYQSDVSRPVYEELTPGRSLTGLLVHEDEAWAVGNNTVVHRRPDGGWNRDVPPGNPQEWWKMARGGSHFMVAGSQGSVAVYTLDAGWAVRHENTQGSTFYGVWTVDALVPTAWVVGGGPSIWLFNAAAGTFDRQLIPTGSGSLYDVWGAATNDVWAVGDDGLVFHFDGIRWTRLESGTRSKLERVRSRPMPGGGRELIIIGERGTVLRKRY